jgi:hypothetical protein
MRLSNATHITFIGIKMFLTEKGMLGIREERNGFYVQYGFSPSRADSELVKKKNGYSYIP